VVLQLNGLTEAEDDLRLGLTPDRDQIVAIRIVPAELAPELAECLALFIEASDRIPDFLTTLQSKGSDDEESKPEDWSLRV
jgi:hypothetical protein